MPHGVGRPRVVQPVVGVVISLLAEPVVAAQPVNVARKSGPPGADEDVRPAAHDGLNHAVEVGVHAFENTPV